MPIKNQAINSCIGSVAVARSARPMKKAIDPYGKTFLPPSRSMNFPILGPISPDTNRQRVKAQKKSSVVTPREADIGTASTAGI